MSGLQSALTIDDLKVRARRRVPKQFFDYSESGSWTETTFRANESDFSGISFRQRVAVDLRDRNDILGLLRELKEIDSRWDVDVLRAHTEFGATELPVIP